MSFVNAKRSVLSTQQMYEIVSNELINFDTAENCKKNFVYDACKKEDFTCAEEMNFFIEEIKKEWSSL